ncbi:MAG: sigma-70 family RNA polymerase sigma factor [Phycisphaerae bacterium]|nr:sigma-70 family RNA polymerase sigma factor [Phycisphaerae bacterium]
MRKNQSNGVEMLEKLAGATWDEIEARVIKRCGRLLASRPYIDPRDACQDVLITILCRGFLMRYDPSRGSFWHYVDGIIFFHCLHLVRQSKRLSIGLGSVEEPAARQRSFDPVALVRDREFREALTVAVECLTPAERSVFADVVDRAQGSRPEVRQTRASVHYARESRCRQRLRTLLIDFAGE